MRKWARCFLQPTLHLGLSPSVAALVHTCGMWEKTVACVDAVTIDAVPDLSGKSLSHADAVLDAHASAQQALVVTLSDEWARFFLVIPPRNARRLQDLQIAAAMRFQQLYGESPSRWRLQGHWNSHTPFLVCALPHTLLTALQQSTQRKPLRLLSVQPQFIAHWNRLTLARPSWFAVVHQQRMTIAAVSPTLSGDIDAIESLTLPLPFPLTPSEWLVEQLSRMALRHNLNVPQNCVVMDDQQRTWSTQAPAPVKIDLLSIATPAELCAVDPTHAASFRLAMAGLLI